MLRTKAMLFLSSLKTGCTLPLLLGLANGLAAQVTFERDIQPIFQKKCWGCHGPAQQSGSLRLDKKEIAMVAGRGEPAIVPGASSQSLLYRRISSPDLGPQMPLTGPLSAGEIAIIKAWIDQGAKWPDTPKSKPAWKAEPRLDALFEQMRLGNFSRMREAIEADRSLVTARNAQGTTLLMQSAVYGSAEDVRWLLDHGADPNAANAHGATALMWALEEAAKVRILLAAGANVNARSEDGQTPLMMALEQACSAGVVGLLLDHGANASPQLGMDPMVLAARNGDVEVMKLLAARREGKFPPGVLTGAAAIDCLPCVQLDLARGVEKANANNALLVGATTARIELLKALLAAGADPNAKDGAGTSALMRAAYSDYADTARVKLLIERGADVNARDVRNDTALRIAKRKGATKVVALLESAGAKD